MLSGRCGRRGSLSATSPLETRAGPGASAMLAARTALVCASASRPGLWTPFALDLLLRLGKFWCREWAAGSGPGGPIAGRSLAALHKASSSAQRSPQRSLTSCFPARHLVPLLCSRTLANTLRPISQQAVRRGEYNERVLPPIATFETTQPAEYVIAFYRSASWKYV